MQLLTVFKQIDNPEKRHLYLFIPFEHRQYFRAWMLFFVVACVISFSLAPSLEETHPQAPTEEHA